MALIVQPLLTGLKAPITNSPAVKSSATSTRRDALLLASLTATAITLPPLAATAASPPLSIYSEESVPWGPFKDLTDDQMMAIAATSNEPAAGTILPSGVRVIDLVVGDGPQPAKGAGVWLDYKVYAQPWDSGKPVADWTYLDGRPYAYTLGSPTDRIPRMIDEGVVGMREGGWRRLIVPDAYGDDGLRKRNPLRGGASYTPPKAGFVVKPHAFAWVELIMVDGGSGRCIERLPEPGRLCVGAK